MTYSVTLTDAAGNTGTAATATSLLETVAPSGYTLTPDLTTYNLITGKSAGFTVTGAEVGADHADMSSRAS